MKDNICVMISYNEIVFIFKILIFKSNQQTLFLIKIGLFTKQLTTNCEVNVCYKL